MKITTAISEYNFRLPNEDAIELIHLRGYQVSFKIRAMTNLTDPCCFD
jgi:hypothetical protein